MFQEWFIEYDKIKHHAKMIKVTQEERKRVENLQKIEKQIKEMEEDYNNISCYNVGYSDTWSSCYFNYNYDKDLKRIIRHRILKLKRKRKEMVDNG